MNSSRSVKKHSDVEHKQNEILYPKDDEYGKRKLAEIWLPFQ